jgi:hypothetical protein
MKRKDGNAVDDRPFGSFGEMLEIVDSGWHGVTLVGNAPGVRVLIEAFLASH